MKKFKFNIRGNKYNVEVQSFEDEQIEVEVNGSKYIVDVEIEKKAIKTPKLVRPKAVPVSDQGGSKTSNPSASKGTGQIKAPLPGTILEMKVKVGDEVKTDDVLLVMEAMKMENNIKAARSGKIIDIKVNNGDAVLEGDVLLEIGA